MRSFSALPPSLLILLLSALPLPLRFAQAAEDDLRIEVTTEVTCGRPTKAGDEIAVHYRGTLQSTGTVFDESYTRGNPIKFELGSGQVIEGWDQGLLDMCPGEKRRLTIPPDLAYGEKGSPPVIPGDATLVFETELVRIVGIRQGFVSTVSHATGTATGETFSIATSPSKPPAEESSKEETDLPSSNNPAFEAEPLTPPSSSASTTADDTEEPGQCHLLGPFALFVQGALGAVALLSLVYKRWRETSRRPWKIFFFDASKQVVGSCLTHVLNLAMSMLGSVDMVHAAQNAAVQNPTDEPGGGSGGGAGGGGARKTPNPCSFYILNLGIDTTLGIPILYLLLKILHAAFLYTPLARPRESIKSGHYGTPPRATWWLKQCLIYFIGLTGMKLFVLFLFAILPWLPWVGDWALRWAEGNEALQIAFAMFVFPLAMNMVQYWIIDNFIMEKKDGKGGDGGGSYERVLEGDEDEDGDEDEGFVERVDEVRGKDSQDGGTATPPTLTEVNPTPIPNYDERAEGSSRDVSPLGEGVEEVDELRRR